MFMIQIITESVAMLKKELAAHFSKEETQSMRQEKKRDDGNKNSESSLTVMAQLMTETASCCERMGKRIQIAK